RERGVEDALPVDARGQAPGMLQGVHLRVQDGAAALHALVVAAAENPRLMNDDRSDGDSAVARAPLGLVDGGAQELVGHDRPTISEGGSRDPPSSGVARVTSAATAGTPTAPRCPRRTAARSCRACP